MLSTEVEATFATKPLPYPTYELSPAISEETLEYHYGRHYTGYLNTLNRLIDGTPYEDMSLEGIVNGSEGAIYNNAAQVWNHEFYFDQFSNDPKLFPEGDLMRAIEHSFESFENMIEHFKSVAMSHFGSGWVWLVEDPMSSLIIEVDLNAGNPLVRGLRPLLTIDLWEHAYYIDYRNNRAEAVDAHLGLVDWAVIECRYQK